MELDQTQKEAHSLHITPPQKQLTGKRPSHKMLQISVLGPIKPQTATQTFPARKYKLRTSKTT